MNIMKKQINLHLRVEVDLEKLMDAIAGTFPVLELERDRLESLFIESLQNGVYNKMPEDLEWRIVNDEYFREFHRKLRDLQTEAEEQLAKEEVKEWEHGYWKDVGAA
jgi:hypothetical protein